MNESQIAVAGAVISLLAALASAAIGTVTSFAIARSSKQNEKRRLCFELEQQFNSPSMFHHRFGAWEKITAASLPASLKIDELFRDHWDESVSAVVHFFESLEQYCAQGLVDTKLAVVLFARPYTLWNDLLLARLRVDEASTYYLPWLSGVRAFGGRLPAPKPGSTRAGPATRGVPAELPDAQVVAQPASTHSEGDPHT